MRVRSGFASALLLSSLAAASCGKKSKSEGTSQPPPADNQSPGNQTSAKNVDEATVTAATNTLVLPAALNILATDAPPALRLSDYENDSSRFYFDDRSMESLKTVQTILCFLSKLGYADEHVVNKGPYIAQFDMAKCQKEGGDGGGGGGGAGGGQTAPQLMLTRVTVDSKREENKPLQVKAWFDMKNDRDGEEASQRIAVNVAIAEGPNPTNPVGIFRLVFLQSMAMGDQVMPAGHGQLEARRDDNGSIVLSLYEDGKQEGGEHSEQWINSTAVRIAVENNQVVGGWANLGEERHSQHGQDHRDENSNFKVAFDRKYFSSLDLTSNETSCRSQSDFNFNVWRYGVYDADTGNRTQRKGGFSFRYEKNDKPGHGWASYHGIWADGAAIADGTVVVKENWQDPNAPKETFTVKNGKGKLTKHVRQELTLDELDGIELNAWTDSGSKRIVWNKSKAVFLVVAEQVQDEKGGSWNDVAKPYAFELSPYGNNFWSEALGGSVELEMDPTTKAPVAAAFFKNEDVTGTAKSFTLYCLQNCLKANLTGEMLSSNGANEVANPENPWEPFNYETAKAYAYDPEGYVLKNNSGSIVLAEGESVPEGSWAPMMSGLVDEKTFAQMRDDGISPWLARSQTVTYSWSVGDPKNSWTYYQALIDANGNVVTFDPPEIITYTHTAENEASGATESKAFGKKFRLQFDGSNLQIPSRQDKDTGFWVNDFAIKGGVKSDDGKFIFKPLEGNKFMKSVDASLCTGSGLDVNQAPERPTAEFYDDSKANKDPAPSEDGLPTLIIESEYAGG